MGRDKKDDGVEDTYPSSEGSGGKAAKASAGKPKKGLRHSIRPRRTNATKEEPPEPPAEPVKVAQPAPEPKPEPEVAQVEQPSKEPGRPVAPEPVITEAAEDPPAAALADPWDSLQPALSLPPTRKQPLVERTHSEATARAYDLLRTKLRQTAAENGWIHIGVTSPTSGCGTTFTTVNLALSLSRLSDTRTILMDCNLRDPQIAQAFAVEVPTPASDFLGGKVAAQDYLVQWEETLALGLAEGHDDRSAERLQDRATGEALKEMEKALAPQIVLYDLPALLTYDDVSAFLPQLDGLILISDGTQTMATQLLECERMIEGQVPLIGVVLNRARASSIPRYA